MLRNKKAVLFDLDGTLIDSMWMWKQIDIDYLGRHNRELPDTLQKEIEGMSFTETANYFKERFAISDSVDAIKAEWLDMARDKYQNETPLKEGVLSFLSYLKKQRIRTGIATSNSIELVQTILSVHHLTDVFDAVHTCCDVAKGKPEPDIYLLVADRLDTPPEECLVFEDVPMGLIAGNSAGMETCAVWDRFSIDQDEEKRVLADYYIHTYHDVLNETYEVLNKIIGNGK